MKLTELVQKESERTKEVIEQPKKVFKKERIWLEEENTIEKPLKENKTDLSIETSTKKDKENVINIENKLDAPIQARQKFYDLNEATVSPLPAHGQVTVETIKATAKATVSPLPAHGQVTVESVLLEQIPYIGEKSKKILVFLAKKCSENLSDETEYITTEELKSVYEGNSKQIADTIYALKTKGYLEIIAAKNIHQTGIRKFRLKKTVIDKCLSTSPRSGHGQATVEPTAKVTVEAPIKKESKLNVLITNFPNVERIGLKFEHLQKTERSEENLLELLTHFEHSLQNSEVKSAQKLPILISIINDSTKTWVSESYLNQLNAELTANQKRVEQFEKAKKDQMEMKLRDKYQNFINENPEYLHEIREKQALNVRKNLSDEVVSNLAFHSWKEQNEL